MPESTKLHEIRSVATEVPSGFHRVWPVQLSHLPCNCTSCIVDDVYYPLNDQCRMRPWRNTVLHKAKIGGVPHDEALTFVGKSVRIEERRVKSYSIHSSNESGRAAGVDCKFGEAEEKLSFVKARRAMKLF